MQLNLFDEQLYSEAALARQKAVVEVFCMEPQEVVATDSEGEDVHFDQWGAKHRVFKTADGEYVGSTIRHYTHEDDAYNQFLRTGVAIYSDQVALVQKLVEDAGRKAVTVPGDLSTEEGNIELVRRAVEELGQIDVLVSVAGKQVYEFAFVMQPMKIQGGTGSTVTPVAIR